MVDRTFKPDILTGNPARSPQKSLDLDSPDLSEIRGQVNGSGYKDALVLALEQELASMNRERELFNESLRTSSPVKTMTLTQKVETGVQQRFSATEARWSRAVYPIFVDHEKIDPLMDEAL